MNNSIFLTSGVKNLQLLSEQLQIYYFALFWWWTADFLRQKKKKICSCSLEILKIKIWDRYCSNNPGSATRKRLVVYDCPDGWRPQKLLVSLHYACRLQRQHRQSFRGNSGPTTSFSGLNSVVCYLHTLKLTLPTQKSVRHISVPLTLYDSAS